MNPTCGLRAPPRPVTVFLIIAGEYSAMATPASSPAKQDDAAGVAEHEGGAGVPGVKGFLDGEDVGLVALEQFDQRDMDLHAAGSGAEPAGWSG